MLDGRHFFSQHAGGGALSCALQKLDAETQLAWEKLSVSEHSPGAVKDDEQLARQVQDPAFFDAQSQQVKPTLFDDVGSRGASVNRCAYLTGPEIHAHGIERAIVASERSTAPKAYIGFVSLLAADVRSILFEDRRAVGVYDTAHPQDASHADVCRLAPGKMASRSVRSQLYQLSKGTLRRPA